MALFSGGLLPASFRGAPFAVRSSAIAGGRRNAEHLYPGRDEPWIEDMGRGLRRFRFQGFICDGDLVFLAGPIALQRALLLATLEKGGSGTLTHPTLGVLDVNVVGFSIGEDLGAGTMSTVEMEFVESGKQSFPSLLTSGSGILNAATLCTVAIAADVVRVAIAAFGSTGGSAASAAVSSACAAQAVTLGQDATSLQRLATQLPGNNGRYAGGAATPASRYAVDTSVAELVADASMQRARIAASAAVIVTLAQDLSTADACANYTAALDAITLALLDACADPADAVRLLIELIANPPTIAAASSAIGRILTMAFQRAAAVALAKACASYQPSSYDDAFALLARVGAVLDAVAVAAADARDRQSHAALRALRAQVVADLRARGAQLSRVRIFSFPAPLPSLVLAQRLYRDPTRAAELTRAANPANPLFFPASFQALAA